MKNIRNKVIVILLTLFITLIFTLGLFYILSWYSFSTYPNPLVFWRIIAIWFGINLLISYINHFKSKSK